MSSPSAPLKAFLFADPAAHSLSPQMHKAAFAASGIVGEYRAERVLPQELANRLHGLRQTDVLGANLSLPHKEAALHLLDDLTPEARKIGAVNTVINKSSRLIGHNTDAPGLLAALVDAHFDTTIGGRPVVILGAGGAARAAVFTALHSLKRDVYVVNRTRSRAEELVHSWSGSGQQPKLMVAERADIPWNEIGLIINSSSAGLDRPHETPLLDFDFSCCSNAGVYDMVYRPSRTRLLREAQEAGLRTQNGLGMLAHQARLAFQAWTGRNVPIDVFLSALSVSAEAPETA